MAQPHHWLTRLYPAVWRDRYADEFAALIEEEGCGWRQMMNIAAAALVERVRYSSMGVRKMQAYPGNIVGLVRKPSAVIPIAMSALALVIVLSAALIFNARHQPDEGPAAHIFQMLIAGQFPFLAWFAFHWLRRDFKGAASVIGLQIAAIAIALFPVWYFGL